ncbi:MAG TPA: hypothetical protein VGI10_01585 [Polyangiaceae bacterium]|jgi:hypothetical protein
MGNNTRVLLTTLALSTGACFASATPPVRLYADDGQPRRAEDVSTLSGYVQVVDGRDVSSLGGPFELLPGCHVIGTPSHWGLHSPGGDSAVTATTGQWQFALPMKAGHQYRIDVILGAMTGPTGSLTIKAHESDLGGHEKREFDRVTSSNDIDACQAAAAASGDVP